MKRHDPVRSASARQLLVRREMIVFLSSVVVTIAVSGVTLLAHDFWIEPTTFTTEPGRIVGARLRVGQDFLGDVVPRDPTHIKHFVVDDPDGRRPLVGRTGIDPAGLLRVSAPGLLVIGYYSNPSALEQPREKFAQYVREEGLQSIAALRPDRIEKREIRELFSRYAKSLVLSGSPDRTYGDRALGFPFELVAERNPYMMIAGQDLPVRLTYENRPLAGALVVAINRLAPAEKLTARSDRNGRATFRLPRGGMWMIKAVHMIPAKPDVQADWESFWASLTFELPQTANAVAPPSR